MDKVLWMILALVALVAVLAMILLDPSIVDSNVIGESFKKMDRK